MNGIDEFVGRSVAFIHVPVPRHAYSSFFEPMRRWRNTKGLGHILACCNSTTRPAMLDA
jgi:hypothetical protein